MTLHLHFFICPSRSSSKTEMLKSAQAKVRAKMYPFKAYFSETTPSGIVLDLIDYKTQIT